MTLLTAKALSKSYGGVHAVRQVDLSIETGRRHVILGPNGAGKSTLFNLLCGTILPTSGSIQFKDMEVSEFPAYQRARLGIGRTFQVSQLFGDLTVQENVLIALFPSRFGLTRLFPASSETRREMERATMHLMEWGLKEDANTKVSRLSYGKQRSLEIVLALAREPQLILLDEPTAGLARTEVSNLIVLLQHLPKSVSVLMIEHDMHVVREIAQWITVLNRGAIVKEGEPSAIFADKEIQQLYTAGNARSES